MKKILYLLIGVIISYLLYYFVAHNRGFLFKIPYAIVSIGSYLFFITSFSYKLKDKSYYNIVPQFVIIISIILAIVTYEFFDDYTFGTKQDQSAKLLNSKSIAIGKVLDVDHFSETTIKRKVIPEHWEVKYEFKDSTLKVFDGMFFMKTNPIYQIGDTLRIKYVKETPEINEHLK